MILNTLEEQPKNKKEEKETFEDFINEVMIKPNDEIMNLPMNEGMSEAISEQDDELNN